MEKNFPRSEEEFNKFLVTEYFKCGSVDGVLRKYSYSLPISYANYQRVLSRWGIVKAAGPNSKLAECIDFFTTFIEEEIPLDNLYKKMPSSFKTSAATLYRILGYIKEGITRRVGCALIITPYNDCKKILVAKDISNPKIELGKPYGAYSLPMGYSRKRDTKKTNITRILQQEVFVNNIIGKTFPYEVVDFDMEPFMYLDITDIRVSVYHLTLPKSYSSVKSFFSYKLKDYKFMEADEILSLGKDKFFRMGVVDAVKGYKKYLALTKRNLSVNPLQDRSILNRELATVSLDVEY